MTLWPGYSPAMCFGSRTIPVRDDGKQLTHEFVKYCGLINTRKPTVTIKKKPRQSSRASFNSIHKSENELSNYSGNFFFIMNIHNGVTLLRRPGCFVPAGSQFFQIF